MAGKIERFCGPLVLKFVPALDKLREVPVLLRGDTEELCSRLVPPISSRVLLYCMVILIGAGMYGAAIGSWRSPLMGAYVAIKFPLILLLTAAGNAVLNGMLAQLLGLQTSFRQVSLAILMSFAITAVILAAFSPIVYFMVLNLAPMTTAESSRYPYALLLGSQVLLIAFAGVAGNIRLLQLLRKLCGNQALARKVLFAWLSGNLFLGMQLTWILRPFFGSPDLSVQFLRPNALQGNFIEGLISILRPLFET